MVVSKCEAKDLVIESPDFKVQVTGMKMNAKVSRGSLVVITVVVIIVIVAVTARVVFLFWRN